MKRVVISSVCFLLLSACNPRPVVEDEETDEGRATLLAGYELLLEGYFIFQENLTFQGLERILHFYGESLSEEDVLQITVYERYETDSTLDLLELMKQKGVFVSLQDGNENKILELVKANTPVLASLYIAGNSETIGIFYGYNDKEVTYYDIGAQRTRTATLPQIKMAAENEWGVKLFVPVENEQEVQLAHGESMHYAYVAILEAYYENNEALFNEVIPIVEKNGWEESLFYTYIYYYLFIKENPEQIAELLFTRTPDEPFNAELFLKYYQLVGNEEEVKNIVKTIQILPQFTRETLETIETWSNELGYEEKAKEARLVLNQMNH